LHRHADLVAKAASLFPGGRLVHQWTYDLARAAVLADLQPDLAHLSPRLRLLRLRAIVAGVAVSPDAPSRTRAWADRLGQELRDLTERLEIA